MAILFRRIGEPPVPPSEDSRGGPPEHFGPEAQTIQARENQARTAALGMLGGFRAGEFPRVHIFIGNGPSGAVGAAAARHLHNAGVPFGLTLAGAREKCAPEAAREISTLGAMAVTPEDVLSEERADDLVASIGAEVHLVAALGGAEMEGRAREISKAIELACAGKHIQTLEFDERFRTAAPAGDEAAVHPDYPPRSREEARLLDSVGIEGFGIPGLVLMENAGAAAAREAFSMLGESSPPPVIVCGRGNNGGDGFVVARHLSWWGVAARVYLVGTDERIVGDARVNIEALSAAGVEPVQLAASDDLGALRDAVSEAPLVVDAVLGTGLSGNVRGLSAEAIELINSAARPVLALDCPSGIDCNTGEPLGLCVRAKRTVTFAAAKLGFATERGRELTGELVVADIGIPAAAYGSGR